MAEDIRKQAEAARRAIMDPIEEQRRAAELRFKQVAKEYEIARLELAAADKQMDLESRRAWKVYDAILYPNGA